MRVIRAIVMAIGVIGILVAGALLIGYYLYSLSPWIQAKMTPIAVSAEAAQSFDQKLSSLKAEIDSSLSTGRKKEVTLILTDKEVNSKLTQVKAKGELPVRDALVNFVDGYFLAYAVADTPGVNAKIGAIGRIEVVNGSPKIAIKDFNLGKLPLPKSVNRGVEGIVNMILTQQLADIPLEITNVQIKNRQLTFTGITKTGK